VLFLFTVLPDDYVGANFLYKYPASCSGSPWQHGLLVAQLTAQRPYTLHGSPCPFSCGSGLPCNIWFLRPTQVLNPNGISIDSAVFVCLTCDRETTVHTTHSVTIGHIYVRSTAMRPIIANGATGLGWCRMQSLRTNKREKSRGQVAKGGSSWPLKQKWWLMHQWHFNNISKILENLFKARIQPHIISSPNFSQLQSAYRPLSSSNTFIRCHTSDFLR